MLHKRRRIRLPLRRRAVAVLLLVLLLPPPPPLLLLLLPLLARVGPLELHPPCTFSDMQGNHRLPRGRASPGSEGRECTAACGASGSAKFESDRRCASAPSLPSYATSAVDDDMWPVACRNRTEPKAGERKKTVRSQRFAAAGSAEGCNVHKTRRRELDSTAPRACGHHRPLASRLTRARIR